MVILKCRTISQPFHAPSWVLSLLLIVDQPRAQLWLEQNGNFFRDVAALWVAVLFGRFILGRLHSKDAPVLSVV